jgi:hypothetical protein
MAWPMVIEPAETLTFADCLDQFTALFDQSVLRSSDVHVSRVAHSSPLSMQFNGRYSPFNPFRQWSSNASNSFRQSFPSLHDRVNASSSSRNRSRQPGKETSFCQSDFPYWAPMVPYNFCNLALEIWRK